MQSSDCPKCSFAGRLLWIRQERLSTLRLDLARKLVAFDIYPNETPVCVAIAEIREIHLVDLVGASTSDMNTLGIRLVLKRKTVPNLYTDDAQQLFEFITQMKSSFPSPVADVTCLGYGLLENVRTARED